MDEAEFRAEQELVADAQALSSAIWEDILAGRPRSPWKERRRQIAALRERIRALRDRHLRTDTVSEMESG
jgi:hypothetical protein